MNQPMKNQFQPIVFYLLIGILLIACSCWPLATAANPISSALDQVVPGTGDTTEESRPDPLDRLLAMRSIKISLAAQHPDGTSRTIDVDIDSAGNMHARYSRPAVDPKILPKGFDTKQLPASREVFFINGSIYQSEPQSSDWLNAPSKEDFSKIIADEMHGADGPALYLDMLPDGSIQAAGKDSVGGFTADKYTVNGKVTGQTISGTIWFEPKADALIQAELTVPAGLFGDPSQAQQGELKITLKTKAADVPPVTLPSASATTAKP
jgi:hypothetical protein